MSARLACSFLVLLAACGAPIPSGPPPVTTLDPPPGAFNGSVTVTMTVDRPATIFYTLDGSDPATSRTKVEAASPVTLELTASTTISFFARASGAPDEPVRQAPYLRAGGPKGTASGVIVVDTIAVGRDIALSTNGSLRTFPPLEQKGEIPFVVTGLQSGQHRLRALADRDDDGNFLPVLDYASETFAFQLDLDDPMRASVENIRLHLGASLDGLCTLQGEIEVPQASLGESVSISALGGGAFDLSGGGDPSELLSQLQNGYQVFAREGTDDYPYVITNLEPGQYIPVPLRTTFGLGGIGLNLLANPLQPVFCGAGEVKTKNFEFGEAAISGTVTLTPPEQAGELLWGLVAAKQMTLGKGLQAVLMPVLFLERAEDGTTQATYAGTGLRRGGFSMRVFTSVDEENPLPAAFEWIINPLSQLPAHATITVGANDLVQDFVLPVPAGP